MPDFDAIVVGAGCGGLTAGALLSARGWRVIVLEQSGAVGGCAGSFDRGGYTFDVGASIFEVLEPLARTFAALGTTIQDEIDLISRPKFHGASPRWRKGMVCAINGRDRRRPSNHIPRRRSGLERIRSPLF
jgi:phytoene dehydrogenase-like protein